MKTRLVAVFDLDDTLSDTEHRRHLIEPPEGVKKNWEAFYKLAHKDEERSWMVARALELSGMGVEIVIFTGRPENGRRASLKWLAERGIEPTMARFRRFKDFRKTAKMKGDWMAELRAEEGVSVVCAVDDEATNLAAFAASGILAIDAQDMPTAQGQFEQLKESLKALVGKPLGPAPA
jgi:hypothetical protein